MGSLKTLFLAVYASNASIRVLFLPSCYLILTSPFILVVARFIFGFKFEQAIPENVTSPEFLPQVLVSLAAVFLATRIISGARSHGPSKDGGKRRVQLLPFWIPGPRHWGHLVFGGEAWLKRVRDSSLTNIIAYNASGARHNVILSPQLLDNLLADQKDLEEIELADWAVLRNAFGMPSNSKAPYLELKPALTKAFNDEIFRGKQLNELVSASIKILSGSLVDLITFNSSIVDQMPWERVAGLDLTDGTAEVECELFSLINEFFCNAILSPITGPQFPESYQLLASDLSTFNPQFYALALGFPRLFPVKGLPTAALAKKRLLSNFTRFFRELSDPRPKRVPDDDESMSGEETDADTPTPLTALNHLFQENDVPWRARAAITVQLLHGLVAQTVPLAFWTILHIYASSSTTQDKQETPLTKIREETKGWAQAVQPPSIHPSFPSPPDLSYTVNKLATTTSSFPYLRSCINEARRLYKAPLTTLKLIKPITLSESDPTRPSVQDKWELDKGSYVDIGFSQSLINTSAANHLSPTSFNPGRFLNSPAPSSVTYSPDSSNELSTALLVTLIAGFTQLWEINPAPKKSFIEQFKDAQAAAAGEKVEEKKSDKNGVWTIPKSVEAKDVKVPRQDIRVRFRMREGLPEPKKLRPKQKAES